MFGFILMRWWLPVFVAWTCETLAIGAFLIAVSSELELLVFVCTRMCEVMITFGIVLRHVALIAREGKLDVDLRVAFMRRACLLMWWAIASMVPVLVVAIPMPWHVQLMILWGGLVGAKAIVYGIFAYSTNVDITFYAWYHHWMKVRKPFRAFVTDWPVDRDARPQLRDRTDFEIPDEIWSRIQTVYEAGWGAEEPPRAHEGPSVMAEGLLPQSPPGPESILFVGEA